MPYALAALALAVFATLSVLVTGGSTAGLDRDIMLGAATLHADALTVLMQILSHVGGTIAVAAVAGLGSLGLWLQGYRRAALRLAGALAVGALVIVLTKLVFERPRPDVFAWLDHPSGESFPSGHSLAGVFFFPLLAQTARDVYRAPRWLVIVALVLGVLIGLSRIYLGVHWPTDVLGGFVLGLALLALVTRVHVRETRAPGERTVSPGAEGV